MEKNIFLIPDQWLSDIMNMNVYSIDFEKALYHPLVNMTKEDFQNLLSIKRTFVFCKVPSSNIKAVDSLERIGFHLVDTNVQMKKQANLKNDVKTATRLATAEDRTRVVEIAKKNFIFSRFHLDPCIKNNTANTIKEKWVDNFFNGVRGDLLVVKELDSKVIGFILAIKKPGICVIDLIAVDSSYRKMNAASDMIHFLETLCEKEITMITGTQIANIPSLRLYESLGFKIDQSFYILHYHS